MFARFLHFKTSVIGGYYSKIRRLTQLIENVMLITGRHRVELYQLYKAVIMLFGELSMINNNGC